MTVSHKEVDLAYAAGIIDGEGCITITEHKGKDGIGHSTYFLRCLVSMNDYNIIEWLHSTFTLGSVYMIKDKRLTTRKTCWCWNVGGSKCGNFLELVLPYLKLKQPQAKLGIKFQQHRQTHRPFKPLNEDEMAQAIDNFNQMRRLNINGRGTGRFTMPPNF